MYTSCTYYSIILYKTISFDKNYAIYLRVNIVYNYFGVSMNKKLRLEEKNSSIYLDEITLAYEMLREELKRRIEKNYHLVSKISSKLYDVFSEGSFFSLNDLKGLIIEDSEIEARNKLMDFIVLIKEIFKKTFSTETFEAKVFSKKEEYYIFVINDQMESYSLVKLNLAYNDKYIVKMAFNKFGDFFNWYKTTQNKRNAHFDSSWNQIALFCLKSNHNEVVHQAKVYKELLSDYRISLVENDGDYIKNEENLLDENIPLIIEIGPRNVKKHQVCLITSKRKIIVDESELINQIEMMKREINDDFYSNSLKQVLSFSKKQTDINLLEKGNRFCICMCPECLKVVKEKTNANKLFIPFTKSIFSKCVVCNNKAKEVVLLI